MNFHELVRARHSIRKYSQQLVPEEVLQRVLDSARIAPSAANLQPWHFFVVRDASLRQRLFPDERQAWAASAPVVIVVCSFPGNAWARRADGKNHADIDIAIATEHIVLAATEEGLGSCWICAFDPKVVRRALELPVEMEPVAMVPLGYSQGDVAETERKSLTEIVTWC